MFHNSQFTCIIIYRFCTFFQTFLTLFPVDVVWYLWFEFSCVATFAPGEKNTLPLAIRISFVKTVSDERKKKEKKKKLHCVSLAAQSAWIEIDEMRSTVMIPIRSDSIQQWHPNYSGFDYMIEYSTYCCWRLLRSLHTSIRPYAKLICFYFYFFASFISSNLHVERNSVDNKFPTTYSTSVL